MPPDHPQPPDWPRSNDSIRAALDRVFNSGDWGRYHGAECAALEQELAAFLQTEFASLCSSGTIAIELALRGLGVGPGDEVLLAAYDFPGNFRAIEATGARPVLVDVNAGDANLDISQLDDAITPETKAILASHLHGSLIDMRQIRALADERGLSVVEDACQCPGAWVAGKRAGAWGDVGVLSFGGSKLLTAGRGGALVTNDTAVLQRIKIFRERGNDAFPLSELQAAVLRPQLQTLDTDNDLRAENAAFLTEALDAMAGLRPFATWHGGGPRTQPSYYKFGLWFVPDEMRVDRDPFSAAARQAGIALDPGFRGFAGRSARRCRSVGDLPIARRAANEVLIWHHPILLEPRDVIVHAVAALREVYQRFART